MRRTIRKQSMQNWNHYFTVCIPARESTGTSVSQPQSRLFSSHNCQKASFLMERRAVGYAREALNWNLVHYCTFKMCPWDEDEGGEKGKSSDTCEASCLVELIASTLEWNLKPSVPSIIFLQLQSVPFLECTLIFFGVHCTQERTGSVFQSWIACAFPNQSLEYYAPH